MKDRFLATFLTAWLLAPAVANAQFVDDLDEVNRWEFFTGDGRAEMDFAAVREGYASIVVDATNDRDNIWWALIKRNVTSALDLDRLNEPHHELRVEARIRTSHAPRRVNLHVNTQRTTDFHTHLMEYDIPDTSGWHTISMITRDFDARPGDTVNAQMALMDWGLATYRVDVDYYRVDVVDTTQELREYGTQVPYHPPIPPLDRFEQHLPVGEAGMIDFDHPETSLAGWYAGQERRPVLTVDGTRRVLLRWDIESFEGREVAGRGVLTLTTHAVQRAETGLEEFGQIRIVEILGGDPEWEGEAVTLESFTQGQRLEDVVNGQMITDVSIEEVPGDTTFISLSQPVLQRILEGRTRGLLLRPLGPISAAFRADEGPVLHFDLAR